MKRNIIILLILLFASPAHAQELWDDAEIDTLPVFRSLNAAMQNPDSVFRLDLSKQKLKEIPPQVFELTQLRELNVSRNHLTELPEQIYKLNNLQRLYANNNKLTALPQRIGTLKNLQTLTLDRNRIEVLPPEMGMLHNLEVLSLWDNELSEIPDEIKSLSSVLKKLELRGILFNEEQQKRIHDLLPYTTIYFSPACNCKQ
ncbi:MAG: leucine-rich repeat domain-containing protein [Bacteroidetes bacterium]|nr:leucine-rich repeat domain-containing protein [Bacteroidota bacterium]MBX7238174.1 leucine-rich repeat domain-containing protein [Bacteroidia bacterium]MCC7513770.1 leucine-rich repeat domain-containing protein [Bacteroidia bacterium]MCW5919186.1 leucine-rich repeat domain-containing protein [Bacteroidota bacterium]HMU77228.1 leucine-rich repeat domain-containing protein [Bacteroidia bacterium]